MVSYLRFQHGGALVSDASAPLQTPAPERLDVQRTEARVHFIDQYPIHR